jgi:hypothetical protein
MSKADSRAFQAAQVAKPSRVCSTSQTWVAHVELSV